MKEVRKNEVFEKAMQRDLDKAKQLVQTVVTEWDSLDLTPCAGTSGLYELIHSPEIPFQEGVRKAQLPPEGLSDADAREFVKNYQPPRPTALYLAAERARRSPYVGRELSLFELDENGIVQLTNQKQQIIKKQSVFAENPNQEKFCSDLERLQKLFNNLNKKSGGQLHRLLIPPTRPLPGYQELIIQNKELREMLSVIK